MGKRRVLVLRSVGADIFAFLEMQRLPCPPIPGWHSGTLVLWHRVQILREETVTPFLLSDEDVSCTACTRQATVRLMKLQKRTNRHSHMTEQVSRNERQIDTGEGPPQSALRDVSASSSYCAGFVPYPGP